MSNIDNTVQLPTLNDAIDIIASYVHVLEQHVDSASVKEFELALSRLKILKCDLLKSHVINTENLNIENMYDNIIELFNNSKCSSYSILDLNQMYSIQCVSESDMKFTTNELRMLSDICWSVVGKMSVDISSDTSARAVIGLYKEYLADGVVKTVNDFYNYDYYDDLIYAINMECDKDEY